MWIQYSELLESKDLDLQLSFVPHDNDTPMNHVTSLEAQNLLNILSILNQEQTSTNCYPPSLIQKDIFEVLFL